MAKQMKFDFPLPDGYQLIFRQSRKTKTGKVIYAKQCGVRAFPMLVKVEK